MIPPTLPLIVANMKFGHRKPLSSIVDVINCMEPTSVTEDDINKMKEHLKKKTTGDKSGSKCE